MSDKRGRRRLLKAMVFLVFLGILGLVYRFAIQPQFADRLTVSTSADSSYKHVINLAGDSYAGYAIIRSDEIQRDLAAQSIKLNFVDDGANYSARIKALKHGDVDMAVFTVDSYVLAGARL